jgi:hypothetical protein
MDLVTRLYLMDGGPYPPAGYTWMYATINGLTKPVCYTINGITARVAVKVS